MEPLTYMLRSKLQRTHLSKAGITFLEQVIAFQEGSFCIMKRFSSVTHFLNPRTLYEM